MSLLAPDLSDKIGKCSTYAALLQPSSCWALTNMQISRYLLCYDSDRKEMVGRTSVSCCVARWGQISVTTNFPDHWFIIKDKRISAERWMFEFEWFDGITVLAPPLQIRHIELFNLANKFQFELQQVCCFVLLWWVFTVEMMIRPPQWNHLVYGRTERYDSLFNSGLQRCSKNLIQS